MNTHHRFALRSAAALCCAACAFGAQAADVGAAGAAAAASAVAGQSPQQREAAAPRLPQLSAEQIVERNVAARGGLAAWRSIKAISYSGNLDAGRVRPDNGMNPTSNERLLDKPGKSTKIAQAPEQKPAAVAPGTLVTLPYTLTMQRPNKQRVEVKFKDQLLVQVYDGRQGWKLQPNLNRPGAQPFSSEELKKAQQFQDIDGPLIDAAAKGTKIALAGTDLVDGRPAYRLKLVLKAGGERRVWVDAETFLDVQVDGMRRLNGRQVAQWTALRDYRTVDGIKVPYLMETRTEGLAEREKIVVEKVALNPKLDDSLFGKPD